MNNTAWNVLYFMEKDSLKEITKKTPMFSIDILKQIKCRNGIYLFNESNIVEIIIGSDMHMHKQILTFYLGIFVFLFLYFHLIDV